MKRAILCFLCMFFLSGCRHDSLVDNVVTFRQRILSAEQCNMDVRIIADYGDKVYSFVMACTFDHAGDMQFCVKEPETIAGITGTIKMDGGFLTFDDQAVAFPLLADEQLTPVAAPWIFMKTLRGGYIRYAGQEAENLRVYIDDSYEEDSLQLDILLDGDQIPLQAEIIWQNRRILSLTIENFTIV